MIQQICHSAPGNTSGILNSCSAHEVYKELFKTGYKLLYQLRSLSLLLNQVLQMRRSRQHVKAISVIESNTGPQSKASSPIPVRHGWLAAYS